jgi:acyl-CoA synthetase (AMP-forming)/AMP-acid ligase II
MISVQEGYNVSSEEIIDYCKTKMANYKCPKQIKVVDDLPKNSVGKIDKIKLKHVYQSSM